MKNKPSVFLEQRRITASDRLRSDASMGNNGAFELINGKGVALLCIAADKLGWEHVSVTVLGQKRTPTWEEMNFVKEMFWNPSETVIQLHPPRDQWVNQHDYCLHLWKPVGVEIPLPPTYMVGTEKAYAKKGVPA